MERMLCYICYDCRRRYEIISINDKYENNLKCSCGSKANLEIIKYGNISSGSAKETNLNVCRQKSGFKKLICSFSGVAPKNIKKAQEYLADNQCHTDFTPDGSAIITSARHKDKYNKLMGYVQLTKKDLER